MPCADFDRLVEGLAALAARHGVQLVGGNLTRSPGPLMIDVTVAGTIKRRDVLTRRGARPGDALYVTGSIGAAAAGLEILRSGGTAANPCTGRYLYPEPRIRAGVLLARNRAVSACMDLSDGLADAVRQVAKASGVGVVLDASSLPVDPCARTWADEHPESGLEPTTWAMSAGDDYELLVAVPPRRGGRFREAIRHAGVAFTRIGECTRAQDLVLVRDSVEYPMPFGYSHFK
jgi:thiamine-monophosphate kinase